LGKYGSFNANLIIGRPFYLTYEILDKLETQSFADIRIVLASEIHAEAILDNEATAAESRDEPGANGVSNGEEDIVVEEDGEVKVKNNQLTIDSPSRQSLTAKEIEELKQSGLGSGKEIIAKIMQSHSHLDEKTAFSLSKYILRKRKKYLKRFTVLPLDVTALATWVVNEKDPTRTMELREEHLGLINCWSNVHCSSTFGGLDDILGEPVGRWLVVDDTGGLIVASLAEKMGLRQPYDEEKDTEEVQESTTDAVSEISTARAAHFRPDEIHQTATSNTLTLLHPATQPNLSLLTNFGYDPSASSPTTLAETHAHPLHTHLHTLSFLQLLQPELDTAYTTPPPPLTATDLASMKTSKRSTYHRKRRRYERTRRVVDQARAGGFDGLVIATSTEPVGILDRTVPLLRGGAQVVVYSPYVEPLVRIVDAYSSARRTAFMSAIASASSSTVGQIVDVEKSVADITNDILANKEDFPLDPRLLLAPTLQTARARDWQVLPGRTHPVMTSKGGAEGYVFTGTKVVPVEGRVEARGRFTKKRKVDNGAGDGSEEK